MERFHPVIKFTSEVIRTLVEKFDYNDQTAKNSVGDSLFMEMLKSDPDYTMHYSPYHWAEEIHKENNLVKENKRGI